MSFPCWFDSYSVQVTISCKGLTESCGPKKPKKSGIPAQVGLTATTQCLFLIVVLVFLHFLVDLKLGKP